MASEEGLPEMLFVLEMEVRRRDLSVLLPFMSGLANTNPRTEQGAEAEHGSVSEMFTVVMEGISRLEDLLQDMAGKQGQPPASKAAIEAMTSVEIDGDGGVECAICLEELKVAKEMPCKHRFHGKCIEKWLGIHGSCPVCRYTMPVDEAEGVKRVVNSDDDDDEEMVTVIMTMMI